MADNTAGQPLGTARVDFVGDTTKLKASADEAQKIVQNAGQKAQAAAATATPVAQQAPQVAQATEVVKDAVRAEKQLEQAVVGTNAVIKEKANALKTAMSGVTAITSTVSRFMGVLGLVSGTLGLIAAGVAGVISWSERAQRSIKETQKTLEDFAKTSDSLLNPQDATDRAIDELTTKYTAAFKSISKDAGLSDEQRFNNLNALNDEFDAQRSALLKRRSDAEAKEDSGRAQDRRDKANTELAENKRRAKEMADQAVLENLDGFERINAEEKKAIADAEAMRSKSDSKSYQEDITRYQEAIREKSEIRRAKFLEDSYKEAAEEARRIQQQEREELQANERVTKARLDAINDIRREATNLFATANISIDTGRIEELLEIIAEKRDRV